MANQLYRLNVINLIRLISRQTKSFSFCCPQNKDSFLLLQLSCILWPVIIQINYERINLMDIL